ncbi:hypothetical protein JCM10908_007081 [Rhodotorula pacifica]|uniref:uncharacterized protein n=1 Tax=Rhodotorula pacifica TaxID=1495444 RepID=UPI003173DA66
MADSLASGHTDESKPWRRNLVTLNNPHPSPLSGTQDLISHFHLEPLYDTFLRPYLPSSILATTTTGTTIAPDADQLSLGGASGAAPGGGAHTVIGQQSVSTQATTMTTLPPVQGQVVLPSTNAKALKGGVTTGKAAGAQVRATPASPATSAGGGGLKITLGGIKLAGLNSPALNSATNTGDPMVGTGTGQKKPRKPKMDKSYDYMVGDVLGRISQPRSSSSNPAGAPSSTSLLHLVSNPDPAPCPPLHPFDSQQLHEAFTLKPGGLAGFDMSIWEARDPSGAGAGAGGGAGDERRRKKKKRKHHQQQGGNDDPHHGQADPKKQRR